MFPCIKVVYSYDVNVIELCLQDMRLNMKFICFSAPPCFPDLRRTLRIDSTEDFSSEPSAFIFLSFTDSSLEIEDCIRLNRAIISSWLADLGFLPTGDALLASLFVLLPEVVLFRGGRRPVLSPSDPMHETVNRRSFRSKGESTSAISAKFKKLHKNDPGL